MTQNQLLYYGLSRNSQDPLDYRNSVSSLANINTETKLQYRYQGLIFYVKDIKKWYGFLDNLNSPVNLQEYFGNDSVDGISYTEYGYENLLTDLDGLGGSLGKIVTVFPLNVSFIFDENSQWVYYRGVYRFQDAAEAAQIPLQLRKGGAPILIDGNRYVYSEDMSAVSNLITSAPNFPINPISGNYYNINGTLYLFIEGKWAKFATAYEEFQNVTLQVNNNIFYHNLNTKRIEAFLVIKGFTPLSVDENERIVKLDLIPSENEYITIPSKLSLTGTLIIKPL